MLKHDFFKLINEIDEELRHIDLYSRPLQASTRLAEKLNFNKRFEKEIDSNDYSTSALSEQVHKWYEARYGKRIEKHLGPGSYILMIKGEPWEVEYPRIFGSAEFTINADLERKEKDFKQIPTVNILLHVKDLTQDTALSLSYQEQEAIFKEYIFGLNAVQSLRDLKNIPFMEEAKNNYSMAVNNLFYKYPNYNNSKWESLQFAEKTIKAKLQVGDIPFQKSHDLEKLAQLLKPINIFIDNSIINKIQCLANVRYGETQVSKQEAIMAIQNSLLLFTQIFQPSSYKIQM